MSLAEAAILAMIVAAFAIFGATVRWLSGHRRVRPRSALASPPDRGKPI